MASGAHELKRHIRIYWAVFISLAILTVVTVSVSNLEHGAALGVFIALVIAMVKGSLVAGFFMHLAFERPKLLFGLLLLSAFFFLVLFFLPMLTMQEARGLEGVP